MFDFFRSSFEGSFRSAFCGSIAGIKQVVPMMRLLRGLFPGIILGGMIVALLALGLWLAPAPFAIAAVDDEITGLSASNNGPTQTGSQTEFNAIVTGGTGISYEWDFGDGSGDDGQSVAYTYTVSGVYTAIVTATNATDTVSDTTTVYVGDVVVAVGPNFSTSYSPANVSIDLGEKVVWVLQGGTHSVTEDEGRFEQPLGSDWDPFIQTFDSADEYNYHCSLHGFSMSGRVTVEAPDEAITGLTAGNDGPTETNSPTAFTADIASGTGVEYNWDFGDGATSTDEDPNYTYTESGVYTATVTASNNAAGMAGIANTQTAATTVYVGDAVVDTRSDFFDPDEVTIAPGGKVVWVLRDGEHSVTADDNSFEQPAGIAWPPFIQTFSTPDTYNYYCTVHGGPNGVGMAGKVIVQDSDDQLELLLPGRCALEKNKRH